MQNTSWEMQGWKKHKLESRLPGEISITSDMQILLLLSRFSHVRFCVTSKTAAHQTPPSLGFSSQEHWSGLPFPSPMHESKKWKWKWSRVWLLSTPWTAAHQAPPSMGFSRQEYWSGVPLPSTRPFVFKFQSLLLKVGNEYTGILDVTLPTVC